MKNQQQISVGQMSTLFFIFLTGSAIINIPGPLIGFAKNGAPLSLILSLMAGMGLLSCILYLYRKFPQLTFIEYSQQLVGKWVTFVISIPFLFQLVQMESGDVLDIGLFMTSSMMRQTPLPVFILLSFLVIALTVRSGIEKFARMFTFLTITVVISVIVILILASPNYRIEHLFPVLPDGFKPVLLGAYYAYGFPYVDVVLFGMMLPYVRQAENHLLKKGMFLVLIFNGFLLIAVTLSTLMVFGPTAGERTYSMFEVARTIDIYEIIQRIESIIGYSLILASYMEAVIIFFILNITITHLLKLKDPLILIFPLALICFLNSMVVIASGQARWVNGAVVIHPLADAIAFSLPLLILTIIAALRKKQNSY